MRGAPVGHRLEPLALVAGELEVAVADAEHPHLGRLDHRDAAVVVVEHEKPLADAGSGVAVALVVDEERRAVAVFSPRRIAATSASRSGVPANPNSAFLTEPA